MTFQHFALEIEDMDSTLEELAERGLEIEASPTVDGAGKQAFFKDPTGNVIELNQPG